MNAKCRHELAPKRGTKKLPWFTKAKGNNVVLCPIPVQIRTSKIPVVKPCGAKIWLLNAENHFKTEHGSVQPVPKDAEKILETGKEVIGEAKAGLAKYESHEPGSEGQEGT